MGKRKARNLVKVGAAKTARARQTRTYFAICTFCGWKQMWRQRALVCEKCGRIDSHPRALADRERADVSSTSEPGRGTETPPGVSDPSKSSKARTKRPKHKKKRPQPSPLKKGKAPHRPAKQTQ